jgi:hypothetical protein
MVFRYSVPGRPVPFPLISASETLEPDPLLPLKMINARIPVRQVTVEDGHYLARSGGGMRPEGSSSVAYRFSGGEDAQQLLNTPWGSEDVQQLLLASQGVKTCNICSPAVKK